MAESRKVEEFAGRIEVQSSKMCNVMRKIEEIIAQILQQNYPCLRCVIIRCSIRNREKEAKKSSLKTTKSEFSCGVDLSFNRDHNFDI